MGYHFTLVKKNEEFVSFEELVEAVRIMGDYKIDEETKTVSSIIGNQQFAICWIKGIVFSQNVDSPEFCKRFVSIGQKLNGRIRGDEMETYLPDGSYYTHEDDLREVENYQKYANKRVKWRKILSFLKIIVLIVIIIVFIYKITNIS